MYILLVFSRCRNIFAIQQNLTNITMSREGDLDRARQYYELLYSNPDVSTSPPFAGSMGVVSLGVTILTYLILRDNRAIPNDT